jgi:hypothetical protein
MAFRSSSPNYMKKNLEAERTDTSANAFFEVPDFGSVAAYDELSIAPAAGSDSQDAVLDRILEAIKWIFLYVPGVAGINTIAMGYVFIIYSKNWSNEFLTVGAIVPIMICAFMIMLGIGKFADLRYLRVVLSILMTSAAAALLLAILIAFTPGNYFGIYLLVTLGVSLVLGYLTKKNIDQRPAMFDEQAGN